MFIASKVVPWLEAPSPEKHTATLPVPSVFAVSAAPTTSGGPPPTMPLAPSMPCVRDRRCASSRPCRRTAPGLAEQFLHHADDVAALGDAVAVPAMGAGDVVLGPEMHAHADGRGFLAGIEMDEAGDAALRELLLHPLLEAADRHHAAIGPEQFLAAHLHGALPSLPNLARDSSQPPPKSRVASGPSRKRSPSLH